MDVRKGARDKAIRTRAAGQACFGSALLDDTFLRHDAASDIWTPIADGSYELSVYGPNGFFRKLNGNAVPGAVDLTVTCAYDTSGITLNVTNNTATAVPVDVRDGYTGQSTSRTLEPGATFGMNVSLATTYNWYDLTVTSSADPDFIRQYAGHVENGKPSVSDPKLQGGS